MGGCCDCEWLGSCLCGGQGGLAGQMDNSGVGYIAWNNGRYLIEL